MQTGSAQLHKCRKTQGPFDNSGKWTLQQSRPCSHANLLAQKTQSSAPVQVLEIKLRKSVKLPAAPGRAPRGLQEASLQPCPQEAPKIASGILGRIVRGLLPPRRPHEAPKRPPRGPQEGSRRPFLLQRPGAINCLGVPRVPRDGPQEASRRPFSSSTFWGCFSTRF